MLYQKKHKEKGVKFSKLVRLLEKGSFKIIYEGGRNEKKFES